MNLLSLSIHSINVLKSSEVKVRKCHCSSALRTAQYVGKSVRCAHE